MENDNIYNKIMELFGKIPENFSILEEQVDIKTQMSYFEQSKKVKEDRPEKDKVFARKSELFSQETKLEQKKEILTLLANLDDVEAFRIIEKFSLSVSDDLKDWMALALQESRMTIESSLLDENQVIISTGLGGKGKKLRYFIVLASNSEDGFSVLQKRLIEKELEFTMKNKEGELEKIEFNDRYCLILTLVPLNISVKDLIRKTIDECNQIGNFINEKFILTNVKVFSIDEITDSWNKASD